MTKKRRKKEGERRQSENHKEASSRATKSDLVTPKRDQELSQINKGRPELTSTITDNIKRGIAITTHHYTKKLISEADEAGARKPKLNAKS